MGDINPETGQGPLLCKEIDLAVLFGHHRRGELFAEQRNHLVAYARERAGRDEFLFIGKSPEKTVISHQNRLTHNLDNPRQALDRAADQVDGKQPHEGEKPIGMVHVEELQGIERLVSRLAHTVLLQVLLRIQILLDDRADDRGRREQNQDADRQFQGTEKIP